MEKQVNTGTIEKKKKKEKIKEKNKKEKEKQTMRMTTARRKPIACWSEINAEGGVESTSRGGAIKDRQRMVGGKAGVEEIGGTLRIGRENLSETPKAAPT
jgi:hypothetical protein